MVQAGEILEIAISLMDEMGADAEREEYELRAPELIRSLVAERRLADGKHGWFMPIDDLEDPVEGVDEGFCLGIMPYGVAAVLLAGDDPTLARFFEECYEEKRDRYERASEAASEGIYDVYGGAGLW